MARNFSRQPVAIAPGLTIRHHRVYGEGECFALEGNVQPLNEAEARRLKKNLDVWLEVVAFKQEQASAEG